MKLKPSGGCRTFLAAFVATLASVVQLFAQTATITWDNPADIVYGTALSSTQLNAVFTNSDTGAQLTGNTIYTPSVGTYLNAGNQQALKVTFIPNAGQGVPGGLVEKTVFVNVTKAPLTATAPSGTPQYGAAVVAFANGLNAAQVTYSGFVNNGAITDNAGNSLTVLPTLAVTADGTTKAGTSRPVTFAVAPTSNNYSITTVNGTMTVTKKLLTFSLADSNMLYGETPTPNALNIPPLTGGPYDLGNNAGTGLGWENNDHLNVQVSQVHAVTVSSAVGSYDITVSLNELVQDALDNYNVQINNGKYNVAQRPLNINVTPGGGSVITYGDALPAFGAQYVIAGGVPFNIPNVAVNGNALNTAAGVLTAPVTLNIPAANANVANSPHAVTTSGGTTFGGNFVIVRNNDALTVNQAPLTIKASNRTKITAVPLPGIEQLQIEFPNPGQLKFGETPGAIITPFPPPLQYDIVTHPLINDGQNGVTIPVGTYAGAIIFNPASLPTAANYNLTLQTGDLVVTLQPAQVGWTPQTTTLTYGEAFDAAKHLNATGTTQIIVNNNPVPLQGAITYTAKLGNNAAIPLVAGQTLAAGTWIIEATFTPAGGQQVAFGPGTFAINFTVNKKSLKVTANDQTRVFGAHPGGFNANAVTYDGFVLGDNAGSLGTQPTVADPTNANTSVGDYAIIPSGGVSVNYSFNYVSGKYTITPAATVVTWVPEAAGVDQTKWITYGTALASTPNTNAAGPAGIAGTITYNVNINDSRALTVPGNNVTATFTPSSPNYASSTITVFLNVVRRNADVIPAGFTMVFGDAMPAITGTADEANGGFLDADGIVTTFKTDADVGSNVGEYFITAEYEDTFGRLSNYTIRLSSGDSNRIFITPATVNIETVNKGSAVLQGQATLTLKLAGLKAEAAVLNGVELSAAQIATAQGANTLTIGNTTYNNVNSGLPAAIINNSLLGRVFNADGLPTFNVPNFSNATEASFTINTVLDTDNNVNDGDGISIGANYVLGTNASATYSVGKGVPTINWAGSQLTYGQAIVAGQLNATVVEAPLNAANKAGTFTYRIGDGNGNAALGAILPAGNHILHVTYVPHPDNQNAFLSNTATVTLTVNRAPLDVRVPAINNYVYGDPLPRIAVTELVFGTVQGNATINNFVNGDGPSIFDPVNGGTQPVVAILPNQNNPQAGFTVGNTPAATTFGQLGAASNYNINHIPNVMPIARRPLTVKASDVTTIFGMNVPLTVDYLNLAPGETAENLQSAGFAFLNPQVDIATLVPGSYTVFANGAFGPNYTVTHTTGTLLVGKAIATINVADNIQVYDGNAKPVSVTTTPAGLATIVTYDGGAAVPVSAGSYNVQVTVNDPNWQGTLDTVLVINPAPATIALSDMTQTYDGNAKMGTVTTTPAGIAVASTYNGNPVAPVDAGTYTLDATITDPNYSGSAQGVFIIEKANAQIALSKLQQVFDGNAKMVEVQTTPAGLATEVLYDTFATPPSKVGTYTVGVTIQDNNYQGSAEGKLDILSEATISITDLVTTYNGDPQSPTITTTPAGLTVNVTYNKNPMVPHEAGTYEVLAVIEDALFSGSATAVFVIEKADTATISFVAGTLEAPWTNIQAPQVTTDPAGLGFQITYNGSLDLPTTTGDYEVKAEIVDRNLSGSTTATFTVGKSPQVITFPAIPNLSISGNPVILVLSATSDSGLPVKYTVASGGATVDANLLTITQPGRVVLTAQQLGNEFYLPADEKVRSFEVSGTGVPLGAAQTEASLNDDGSVNLGVSGSPFQSLSIYSASVVDAEFKPIVKIVLDENGKGSFNSAADQDQRFFQVK